MSLQSLEKQTHAVDRALEPWKGGAATEGFAVADTAAPLLDWRASAAALAIWRRMPPADIGLAIERQPLDAIQGWRLTTNAGALETHVREALSACGLEQEGLRRHFATDMTHLGRVFATATGAKDLEVRFEVVKGDACRRFHTDSYPERLAVTYVGPGTVVVPRCHSERALAEQDDYSGPVLEIPAFWVSLFAGEQPGRVGLVHRSPRITGTGAVRLFFCVNAARN